MKKIFFIITFLIVFICSGIIVALASNDLYRDIDETNEYYLALRYLTKEGVIEGYYDGYFRPEDPILRAELIKMLMDVFYDSYSSQDELSCFPDIPNFEWYTKRVCKAKSLGFVSGFKHDGLFHPDWNATRAEGSKMILNTLSITPTTYDAVSPSPWIDLDKTEWFYSFAKVIKEKNLFPEDWNTFYPYYELTRGLAAELIFRSIVMLQTGMDTYLPEAISTWEFGGHDDGTYIVKTVNTDDSITLTNGEKVRLIGVDKPELYAADCYADEALAYTKNALLDQEIELKKDAFGDDKTPQGELLRYVYFKGEHSFSFNYQVLYDGYAYVDESDLYQFYYDLINAMSSAYATGRGLWDPGACRESTRSLLELKNYPSDEFVYE